MSSSTASPSVSGGAVACATSAAGPATSAALWRSSIDATLHQPAVMAAHLERAGFAVEAITTRPPYEFEYPTTRVYAAGVKRQPPPSRTM